MDLIHSPDGSGPTYFDLLHKDNISGLDEYLKTRDINEELSDQSLLYWAVFHGSLMFVKHLVLKGADINKQDRLGRTPFLIACYFGFTDIVTFLLENGADITIKDNTGASPIKRAEQGWDGHLHYEIVELLKQAEGRREERE